MDEIQGSRGHYLIFLPDWFVDPEREWEYQIPYFRDHFRCYTYHLEQTIPREYKGLGIMEYNRLCLEKKIRDLGESVRIVAHGVSTILAMQLAASMPKKVRAMVLISARYTYRDQRHFRLLNRVPSLIIPLYLLFRDPLGEHLSVRERLRMRLSAMGRKAAGEYMRDLLRMDLLEDGTLHRIAVRSCLIAGDQDPISGMEISETINEALSNSYLIRYASMAHNPHREGPEIVNHVIHDFLKKSEGIIGRSLGHIKGFFKNLFGR